MINTITEGNIGFYVEDMIEIPYITITILKTGTETDYQSLMFIFDIPKSKIISINKSKFIFNYTAIDKTIASKEYIKICIDKNTDTIVITKQNVGYMFPYAERLIEMINSMVNYISVIDDDIVYKSIHNFIPNENTSRELSYRVLLDRSYENIIPEINGDKVSEMRFVAMLVEDKVINPDSLMLHDVVNREEYDENELFSILYKKGIYTLSDAKNHRDLLKEYLSDYELKIINSIIDKFQMLGVW